MKDFTRDNLLFSLCGLNCGLCSMHLSDYCPGCGGGAGNQTCAIAKCSLNNADKHDDINYCYQCEKFPCEKYKGIDEFDSFITHRNQLKDLQKAKQFGMEAYQAEQMEKIQILQFLLQNYNAGRQKTFFCVAVNLLELQDIKMVMEKLTTQSVLDSDAIKEKAAFAVNTFEEVATQRNIELKLRKKNRKK